MGADGKLPSSLIGQIGTMPNEVSLHVTTEHLSDDAHLGYTRPMVGNVPLADSPTTAAAVVDALGRGQPAHAMVAVNASSPLNSAKGGVADVLNHEMSHVADLLATTIEAKRLLETNGEQAAIAYVQQQLGKGGLLNADTAHANLSRLTNENFYLNPGTFRRAQTHAEMLAALKNQDDAAAADALMRALELDISQQKINTAISQLNEEEDRMDPAAVGAMRRDIEAMTSEHKNRVADAIGETLKNETDPEAAAALRRAMNEARREARAAAKRADGMT